MNKINSRNRIGVNSNRNLIPVSIYSLSIGLRLSFTDFAYKVFLNAKYQFSVVLPALCVFYWL